MGYLIIAIILIIILILLAFIFEFNLKKLKKFNVNNELNVIVNKIPSNLEVCKYFLSKFENENVKIEEINDSNMCMYIALSNKIIIGNIKNDYIRIQTIAHECIHSIQDRKILIFNTIFSNIYFIYFVITLLLIVFKVIEKNFILFGVLIIFSFVYYMVRSYLENDAISKSYYEAKEYLNQLDEINNQEKIKVCNQYLKIDKLGMKCVDYNLFLTVSVCMLVFLAICCVI